MIQRVSIRFLGTLVEDIILYNRCYQQFYMGHNKQARQRELDFGFEVWEQRVHLQEQDPRHEDLVNDSLVRLSALRERFFLEPVQQPELAAVGCRSHKELSTDIRSRGLG